MELSASTKALRERLPDPEWVHDLSRVLDRDRLRELVHSAKEQPNLGHLIVLATDYAVETRWEPALRRAAAAKGATAHKRVLWLRRRFIGQLSSTGAVTGGVFPFFLPHVAVPAAALEATWATVKLTDLILTIAVIYGHEEAPVEERRAWVLSILAFGDAAGKAISELADEPGGELDEEPTTEGQALLLGNFNSALTATVVAKYGAMQTAIAVGHTVPVGGAFIGAGGNFLAVRVIAQQAEKLFGGEAFDQESAVSGDSGPDLSAASAVSEPSQEASERPSQDGVRHRVEDAFGRLRTEGLADLAEGVHQLRDHLPRRHPSVDHKEPVSDG